MIVQVASFTIPPPILILPATSAPVLVIRYVSSMEIVVHLFWVTQPMRIAVTCLEVRVSEVLQSPHSLVVIQTAKPIKPVPVVRILLMHIAPPASPGRVKSVEFAAFDVLDQIEFLVVVFVVFPIMDD